MIFAFLIFCFLTLNWAEILMAISQKFPQRAKKDLYYTHTLFKSSKMKIFQFQSEL